MNKSSKTLAKNAKGRNHTSHGSSAPRHLIYGTSVKASNAFEDIFCPKKQEAAAKAPKIVAKKSLGQNFLKNADIATKIAQRADIPSIVIEIGSGTGMLTKAMLQNPNIKRLICIEKDLRMMPTLEKMAAKHKIMHALNDDAMKCDFIDIMRNIEEQEKALGDELTTGLTSGLTGEDEVEFESEARDEAKAKTKDKSESLKTHIIANLPYNVGTKILIRLLELQESHLFDKITIMLQMEVCDRIVAKPKTKEYGRLAVLAQTKYNAKKIISVSPANFSPEPSIMSCVVELEKKDVIPTEEELKNLSIISDMGFLNRRKFLLKNLKQTNNQCFIDAVAEVVDADARVEAISVEELLNIAKHVTKKLAKS